MNNTKLINLCAKAVGLSSQEFSRRIKSTLFLKRKCCDIQREILFSPHNRKLFNDIFWSSNVATFSKGA